MAVERHTRHTRVQWESNLQKEEDSKTETIYRMCMLWNKRIRKQEQAHRKEKFDFFHVKVEIF